jgi:hypothetical protein
MLVFTDLISCGGFFCGDVSMWDDDAPIPTNLVSGY